VLVAMLDYLDDSTVRTRDHEYYNMDYFSIPNPVFQVLYFKAEEGVEKE
jgi:hypothetical protein